MPFMSHDRVTEVFAEGDALAPPQLFLYCRICREQFPVTPRQPTIEQLDNAADDHYERAGHSEGR